jgi:hypothetical protein
MPSEALKIPITLRNHDERRRAERFVASMPVSVNGLEGTTNDLSISGLSFHADRSYEPGARIDVVIEYLLDGHQYPLACQAEVVRSQADHDGFTIGARLLPQSQSQLVEVPVSESQNEPEAPPSRPALRSID